MYRELEDTIELGTVSADTKGKFVGLPDQEDGERIAAGLADD